jgi:predicted HicB family RNase H-like nuclease
MQPDGADGGGWGSGRVTAGEQSSQADVDTIAMLSVRVHPELRKRLKRHSVESGKSMQQIVEEAIARYLDDAMSA